MSAQKLKLGSGFTGLDNPVFLSELNCTLLIKFK